MVTSDFTPEMDMWPFRACAMKICNITLICGPFAEIFACYRKSGSWKTIVTSDFTLEVELQPFRACAVKNTPYNRYLRPNRQNFRVVREIGVEELDGDVILYIGYGTDSTFHRTYCQFHLQAERYVCSSLGLKHMRINHHISIQLVRYGEIFNDDFIENLIVVQ